LTEENSKIIHRAYESSGLGKGAFAKTLKVSAGHISDILNGKGNASDSLAEFAAIQYLKAGKGGEKKIEDEAMAKYHEYLDLIIEEGTGEQQRLAVGMLVVESGKIRKKRGESEP